MKTLPVMFPFQISPPALRVSWLLALAVMICLEAHGQTPALTECTQTFYRGDYARAAELAEKHLRQHPGDAPVRMVLARADLAQGKFQRAFEGLQKVLASDPKNIDALYYLSILARELSHREYERLFSLAPDSDRVHQLLGEAMPDSELEISQYGRRVSLEQHLELFGVAKRATDQHRVAGGSCSH